VLGKNRVNVCLVFRNAADYLREWLLFHLASGVDHFYLYNNDSTDAFHRVLFPFISRGFVELFDWPGMYQQGAVYMDCLNRVTNRSVRAGTTKAGEWLAFIDDDEFLFDSEGFQLGEALEKYTENAGVAVPWFLYGTSNQVHATSEPVIRRFTLRHRNPDQHHKCIVIPERIVRPVAGGHLFECRGDFQIVDQGGFPVTEARSTNRVDGSIRINHYLTKSCEELIRRRTSRSIDTGLTPKFSLQQWIEFDRNWNDVEDRCAQRFLGRMAELSADFPEC